MKKTLIASAIAAATLSSTAFAMDPASELASKLDSMPTVYGNIQLYYKVQNVEGVSQTYGLADGGSTIGFKHNHEIAPGLTGFYKAEFDWNVALKAAGAFTLDEGYYGVKGDFGKVWAGTDDTAYENVDVIDYSEQVGVAGDIAKQTETGTINYQSPSFNGVVVQTTLGVKSKTADDYEFSAAATYKMGDTTIIGAFSLSDNGSNAKNANGANVYAVAVTHALGDISVAGQLEYQADNQMLLGGIATYSMGKSSFTGGLTYSDSDAPGSSASTIKFSAQAKHNVSDHMYAFVEVAYAAQDSGAATIPDVNTTDLALGAVYEIGRAHV